MNFKRELYEVEVLDSEGDIAEKQEIVGRDRVETFIKTLNPVKINGDRYTKESLEYIIANPDSRVGIQVILKDGKEVQIERSYGGFSGLAEVRGLANRIKDETYGV